jgi:uncharacterized SAM-binding protein YcdF (DUF218 family)
VYVRACTTRSGMMNQNSDDQPDQVNRTVDGSAARHPRLGKSPRRAMVIGALAVALIAAWQLSDSLAWQKFATELVSPCSCIWWGMAWAAATVARGGRLWRRYFLWALFLGYGLAGNVPLGRLLVQSLEQPFVNLHPLDGPRYDLVVVLGGGTNIAHNGAAQLGTSGDRIMLAARLYHRGRAERILCTGTGLAPRSDRDHPAQQAHEILIDLGVPAHRIVLGAGRTTWEEMQDLRERLANDDAASKSPHRVGLVSSAWHLRRALRLAHRAGIAVEPLPADFVSMPGQHGLRSWLPQPDGFRLVHSACREYLAPLLGR